MLLSLKLIAHLYKYKRKQYFQWSSFIDIIRLSSTTNHGGLKVLFFGTDEFSVPSLNALAVARSTKLISDLGVVTSFKNPPNCIKLCAESQKIPTFKWPVTTDICRKYDLGIVVSFGHLIPSDIIYSFSIDMINVHASILPRWRGAAPIIHAIMNGDAKTGVSIMKIEPNKFDIGDILAHDEVDIGAHTLMPELHGSLSNLGALLLLKVISGYPESFRNARPQIDKEATYAPKITTAVAEVNWNTMTSAQIYNLYRALYGFKFLSTSFGKFRIKLIEVKQSTAETLEDNISSREPGSFDYIRERKILRVSCSDTRFIEVARIKVEGKREMNIVDFHNGFCKNRTNCELRFRSW